MRTHWKPITIPDHATASTTMILADQYLDSGHCVVLLGSPQHGWTGVHIPRPRPDNPDQSDILCCFGNGAAHPVPYETFEVAERAVMEMMTRNASTFPPKPSDN
jgi:hypothetical protein